MGSGCIIQFGGDRMEELVIRHGTRMLDALAIAFPDDLQQELGASDTEMISLVGRCIASQMCNWVEMMGHVGIGEEDALELMTSNVSSALEMVKAQESKLIPSAMH